MDHDEISYLRANSRAWRLLRADSAPLVLGVLGQIFVAENVRTISESDLLVRVDDLLYAANAAAAASAVTASANTTAAPPGGTPDESSDDPQLPAYRRSARGYLDLWAAPEQGWLRKFYPDGTTEAHYDATSDLEKAYAWVCDLRSRTFVGTESRLHTVIDLLRQMVHGAESDPAKRLARLREQRLALDAEIAGAETGFVPALDRAGLLDRYQHLSTTARELLADFREVEENFRSLDRGAREKIAAWAGSKGELLEELVGDRHAIAASDQGRSFQAFHDFLLSRTSQAELTELTDRLVELSEIDVDPRLRHVHHDWLDAAERTQQTVRALSEQLRRFLDDKVWLENRRVMDLLRSIERQALLVRDAPAAGFDLAIDGLAPRVRLPMERPLHTPSPESDFGQIAVSDADGDLDPSALFEQVHIDMTLLVATVRSALRGRDQVTLEEVLEQHPPTQGLAEIVGYLAVNEGDMVVVSDEDSPVTIPYVDSVGRTRSLRMPRASFVRQRRLARTPDATP